MQDHESFMKRALRLAEMGERTAPNPRVGCVIVKGGEIVGEGYHKEYGGRHAEVLAIEMAGGQAEGADMYVTLEPCCHLDKQTPPCAGKIIGAGIKRVYAAMEDPNPKVNGKGIAQLKENGIEAEAGIMEKEARKLNEPYAKWITTGMPFVVLKLAMSLDGKIATGSGESRWISNESSRRLVHEMRKVAGAIMLGVNTVIMDNPSLSAEGASPLRVIAGNPERIPSNSKILDTARQKTLIACVSVEGKTRKMLEGRGAEVLELRGKNGRVDLRLLLKRLGERKISSVLAEGGGEIAWSLLKEKLADRVAFFVAPKIFGGKETAAVAGEGIKRLEECIRIKNAKVKNLGGDFLFEGEIDYPHINVREV